MEDHSSSFYRKINVSVKKIKKYVTAFAASQKGQIGQHLKLEKHQKITELKGKTKVGNSRTPPTVLIRWPPIIFLLNIMDILTYSYTNKFFC